MSNEPWSGEACPMPRPSGGDEDQKIQRMLNARRIAVVGLSDDPLRPSYDVAAYLRSAGKIILPVNPNYPIVMGLKCYASLADVPGDIDVVDVFRRSEYCPEVVQQAIDAGAKGVWLQSGVVNDDARRLAEQAGIDFVQDRCMKVEHMRRG